MADLKRVFNFAFHDGPWTKGYFIPEARVVNGPFQIGDLALTAYPLPHGRTVTNGYLFRQGGQKKFLYFSDCKEVPAEVIEQVKGVEVAILDALRYTQHPTHMNLEEALAVAGQIGAKRTLFTHLTHEYDHDIAQAQLPAGVELAYDGQQVELA